MTVRSANLLRLHPAAHSICSWRIFLPVLFTLGALYVLFRKFFGPDEMTEEEKEEEQKK